MRRRGAFSSGSHFPRAASGLWSEAVIHPRGQRRWWSRALLAIALTPVVLLAQVAPATAGADDSASGSAVSNEAPAPDSTEAPAPEPSESTPTPSDSTEPTPTPDPSPTEIETPEPVPSEEPTPEADPDEEPDDPSADARLFAAGTPAVIPPTGRLAGADRYAVTVAASAAAFPGGASTVLVASGFAPSDGVIAAGLAARVNAPLLYVAPTSIPSAVAAELRRLSPASVVVIGGPGSVSDAVLESLRGFASEVTRFGGTDRFDASRTALMGSVTSSTAYIAEGLHLVDAPLAAVAAAVNDAGFLLVDGRLGTADAASIAALRAVGVTRVIIVGGTSRVSPGYESSLRSAGFTVQRRAAADRYGQSVLLAKERPNAPQRVIVANPASASDTAVAASLAASTRQPLVYTSQPCMLDAVSAYISSVGVGMTALGGAVWLDGIVLSGLSCSTERTNRQSALASAIRSTMSQYQGTFSVTVREIGGLGQTVSINSGQRLEPASMIKIFAAWAALERIEHGRATFATRLPSGVSLGGCLYVMIHASDNYCHTDIVHWIGISEINRMIRSEGFPNTYYGSVPPGVSVLYAGNRATANDLSYLMVRLENGTILNRSLSDHLISLMRQQIFRTRIASGIPPGIGQATKPGALWLTSGLMQGDTGIVWGTRSTYAISIIGDNGPPQAALRAISRTVYEHFNGTFGTAMRYPIEQVVTTRPAALRATPNGSTVYVAPAGTPLQVLDANRIWYQVQWGQRQLWVWYEDLRNR